MKAIFAICFLIVPAVCFAETWRCTDATHTYISSQKVPGDTCTMTAKANPHGAQEYVSPPIDKKSGILIGMSKADVTASSWGKPKRVNRTTTASGLHEQWVYDTKNLLYFDNGVLTAIQN